jgi:uncharacterized oxidoreductase
MDRYSHEALQELATETLSAMGSTRDVADEVGSALVRADLRGHGSHGIRLLPAYRDLVDAGLIVCDNTPSIIRHSDDTTAFATVDGNGALGQLTGRLATELCVEAAENHGIGYVLIRNGTHLGRIGEFAEQITEEGMLFAGFVNGPQSEPVAPAGSASRRLSTNPLAFGVPTFEALPFPIILDMATSQVALGKIKRRAAAGEQLPPSWTTTPSGDPVRNPEAFLEGAGAILPLGGRATGHKGYGLSVIAELVAGVAAETPVVDERENQWGNGAMFVAVDLTEQAPSVEQKVAAVSRHVRSSSPIDESETVLLPGEYEYRSQKSRLSDGIPLADDDRLKLWDLAGDLGVQSNLPETLQPT